ncbi:MAG: LysR family transcriptional regulator [Oleispira sp.]
MKLEQLARYDIKLLVALQVLLEEENVSRAADRLSVTQSAMSKMLARLKETFGEELFIRTSHGIQANEKALALKLPLADALASLNTLLTPKVFKASECERTFRISMLDNAATRVLPKVLQQLSKLAPKVKIQLKPWSRHSLDDLASGQLDLVMNIVDIDRANFYQQILSNIEICAVVRQNHPLTLKETISLDDFLAYSFIKVIIPELNEHHDQDQKMLAAINKKRHTVFETNNSNCALQSLVKTDYVMFGAKSPLDDLYGKLGLTTITPPKEFLIPPFNLKFIWHQRQNLAAEQVWFRNLILSELKKERVLEGK